MKLIDKAAVVAEIEKLQLCTMDEHMNYYSAEAQGEYNALSKLESFLDTLEVKEVDLDLEITLWANTIPEIRLGDVERLAKHFYELGLKAKEEKRKYIGHVGGTFTTTTK